MQLSFELENKELNDALRKLDKQRARRVIVRALNDTENKARTMLAEKARDTYAIKRSGFKHNVRLKRASSSNLAAYILVSGHANELKDFRVSPATYAWRSASGGLPSKGFAGKRYESTDGRLNSQQGFSGSFQIGARYACGTNRQSSTACKDPVFTVRTGDDGRKTCLRYFTS